MGGGEFYKEVESITLDQDSRSSRLPVKRTTGRLCLLVIYSRAHPHVHLRKLARTIPYQLLLHRFEGLTRDAVPHGMGVMIFGNGTGGGLHFRDVRRGDK